MKGYQLKITIKGSSPPIWRRVIVPEKISFEDLDNVIEYIFGWTHDHLFSFVIPKERIYFNGPSEAGDEEAVQEGIDRWFYEKAKIIYTYDFGDDWEHTILVEKILDYDKRYPQVVKFKGPNMIEDCGGIWGFYDVIDQAEPFEMEKVNEYLKAHMKFSKFEGSTYPEDYGLPYSEKEMYEELRKYLKTMAGAGGEENFEDFGELEPEESLEEVFKNYKKDDLLEIARDANLPKPARFKKAELAQWLKNSLLESGQFRKVLTESTQEEVGFFQEAIEEKGIYIQAELVSASPLLSFYCGLRDGEFLTVPKDVEEKFRKIYTGSFQRELERHWELFGYCKSAVYLYGVISLEDLAKIYRGYEHKKITAKELADIAARYPGEMTVKDGYLMEEELEEVDLYVRLLEDQEKLPYYLPMDKEDFLRYGEVECQEPDEHTLPMLEFFSEEMDQDMPHSLILYYAVLDSLQKNGEPEECASLAMEYCKETRKGRKIKLTKIIKNLQPYVRTWENRGFTDYEVEAMRTEKQDASRVLADSKKETDKDCKVVAFPGTKKIYPNDPCPCGSGKKYKYCCGRKKK